MLEEQGPYESLEIRRRIEPPRSLQDVHAPGIQRPSSKADSGYHCLPVLEWYLPLTVVFLFDIDSFGRWYVRWYGYRVREFAWENDLFFSNFFTFFT